MKNKQIKNGINQRDNRFSIRKFNVGVASIAVSSVAVAGIMFLGNENLAHAAEGNTEFNGTGSENSTVVEATPKTTSGVQVEPKTTSRA